MWSGDFKAADWEEACPSVVPKTAGQVSVDPSPFLPSSATVTSALSL